MTFIHQNTRMMKATYLSKKELILLTTQVIESRHRINSIDKLSMATQVFDPRNDFNFLTEGVATIENGSGLPSSIIIYGEKAFPVAVDEDDNPFIAASIVGDGHLLHIGHEKHLKDAIEGAGDTDRLIRNAVAWMSQGVRSPVIGIENGL
ncbi:MAG: hypothetical protein AB8B70_11995, partial [Prochlorococcus sp.]